MPKVFMYVVASDGGFAPNPFHRWCTLACCKPAIRRRAQAGDWVVGISPRAHGNRLVFAMHVAESLSFEQYWSDKRFRAKRPPERRSRDRIKRAGDNCYEPIGNGRFRQLAWSGHWNKTRQQEDAQAKATDLGGERVLVGRRFAYFGKEARPFPPALASIPFPGRGHRVKFAPEIAVALLRYLERLDQGRHGRPSRWKEVDSSPRDQGAGCA